MSPSQLSAVGVGVGSCICVADVKRLSHPSKGKETDKAKGMW